MNEHNGQYTRRSFWTTMAGAIASCTISGACHAIGQLDNAGGRLKIRPHPATNQSATGQIMLGLERNRDAILRLPERSDSPLPLLVMLHGATQNADDMLDYLGSAPDEAGLAVLAPNSRAYTWDAIAGSFGSDVDLLNRALDRVFDKAAIDPARVAIGGFSDGATYALSLGLINGDLFSRVVAFSPGFVVEGLPEGRPRVFISHGTADHILPIDACGRRIAATLKVRGYDVTFREFAGDHEIPPDIAREALLWAAAR
jgi:predicted esterase